MTDIQMFNIEGADIRFGTTEEGEPYAVAADFAKVMGYTRTSDAMSLLDDAEKGAANIRTPGGVQKVGVIYEDGMWELIFRSSLPGAKAIKGQVKKILKEIRKTGSYSANLSPAEMLLAQAQQLVDQERRLKEIETTTKEVTSKVAALEGAHNWFTALGYAINNNYKTERNYLMRVGKKASAIMREKGEAPQPRQDATFGKVNTYPVDVLEVAFEMTEES